MIFHYPYIVSPGGNSGSQVRPYKMIKAFEAIGYEVEPVVGYGAERRKAINRIKREVKQGKKYDFIYSESSTMPTLLTEVHHYPTYPFLDFGFFKWAKRNSIPIGLFYRDIHWRFSHYINNVPWFKRAVSIPLYRYDWLQYKRLLDHLFLPSLKMQGVLPGPWDSKKISELPPGCQLNMDIKNQSRTVKNGIQLFYVGGVIPPAYNLKPLFQTVSGVEGIRLTLCCREQEWNYASKLYAPINSQNVEIIHLSGSELTCHYENSDIFALLWSTYEYLDFGMPVKVFETLGYGVPILTLDGTEAARFITQENIGWVVRSVEEASDLLEYLRDHREDIDAMKQRVSEVRLRHTWEERARQVVQTLTKN
jgi:glycosyltransferase involved in cell wall biosynthesis